MKESLKIGEAETQAKVVILLSLGILGLLLYSGITPVVIQCTICSFCMPLS